MHDNDQPRADAPSRLAPYFQALQRALWARRAVRWLTLTTLSVSALLLTARVLASLGAPSAGNAVVLIAAIVVVGGVVAAVRSRPTIGEATRAADAALGLHARLATAHELLSAPERGALAARQLADTIATIEQRPAGRAFPIGVSPRLAGGAVALTAFTVVAWLTLPNLSGLLPNPFAAQPAAATASGSAPDARLTDSTANDIASSVDDLRRRIQERQLDPAEAARLLDQAEARLNARAQQSNTQQQNIDTLADALRQSAAGQTVAGALDAGDAARAADALNELARESDQLSPAARQELARALERAANAIQDNPQLRDAMRRAAQALTRGDYREIERALRNLSDQVNRAGNDVAPQNELGRVNDRLEAARRELGQQDRGNQAQAGPSAQRPPANESGQPGQPGQPGGQGQQPGQGGQPSAGQPSSQLGQGQGQNQPGDTGQAAQAGQGGQQPGSGVTPGLGTGSWQDRPSDGQAVGGTPVQLDGPDSDGQLRPSDGRGEQRGTQVTNARPVTGAGAAQPTDPIDSVADTTRIAPGLRPAVRSYFTPGSR